MFHVTKSIAGEYGQLPRDSRNFPVTQTAEHARLSTAAAKSVVAWAAKRHRKHGFRRCAHTRPPFHLFNPKPPSAGVPTSHTPEYHSIAGFSTEVLSFDAHWCRYHFHKGCSNLHPSLTSPQLTSFSKLPKHRGKALRERKLRLARQLCTPAQWQLCTPAHYCITT